MRRALVVTLTLALAAIGCQNHKKPADQTPPGPDAVAVQAPAPPAPPAPPALRVSPAPPPAPALGGGAPVGTPDAGVRKPNPASKFCLESGGKLALVESTAGTAGVCVFDDGSRCEEWQHFKNKCKPGDCRETSGVCEAAAP